MGFAVLSDPAALERRIRKTGGVQGSIAGVEAWGHEVIRYVPSPGDPDILNLAKGWKVPRARIPADPEGAAVVLPLAGTNYVVRSVETDPEDDDGALSVLILRRA